VVYFPAGTYIISEPIIFYYMTQLIGDARDRPVLKAASSLRALALIDASPYGNNGQPGWTSTNVFLRQIRNLVIDGTAVPVTEGFQGIHWPASQATTIQNVKIIMTQSNSSPHCGIFVENGRFILPYHSDEHVANFSRVWRSYGRPRNRGRTVWFEHRQSAVHYTQCQDFQGSDRNLPNLGLGFLVLGNVHQRLWRRFLNDQRMGTEQTPNRLCRIHR